MNNTFPAESNLENGFGFQQGSTDGVYNQYYRGGFHRFQRPEFSRKDRDRFNLKGCNKAYRHHYDPDGVIYVNHYSIMNNNDITNDNIENTYIINKWNYGLILILLILFIMKFIY